MNVVHSLNPDEELQQSLLWELVVLSWQHLTHCPSLLITNTMSLLITADFNYLCQLKLHASWLNKLLLYCHCISIFIHYSILLLIINQSHINYKHSLHLLQLLCTLCGCYTLTPVIYKSTECTTLFAVVQHLLSHTTQFLSNVTGFTHKQNSIIDDVGLYKFLMSADSSACHWCVGWPACTAICHLNSFQSTCV